MVWVTPNCTTRGYKTLLNPDILPEEIPKLVSTELLREKLSCPRQERQGAKARVRA